MASAARRLIIGGGAPIIKNRRGSAHKLTAASAARPTQGFNFTLINDLLE